MLGPDYNPYQGTRSHSGQVALRLLCIVVGSRPLLRFMQVTVEVSVVACVEEGSPDRGE
jgi:hypothetical protein